MSEDIKDIKKNLISTSKKLIDLIEKHNREFGVFFDEDGKLGDNDFLNKMKQALAIFKSLEIKK